MELRKIELFKNDKWFNIDFIDLKEGDIFRMFEPDGTIVKNEDGQTEFTAISNPYIHGEYKTLTINVK